MSTERWLAFAGVLLVVLCTPGPDFAVVLRHALAGTRRGARAAAGVLTGLTVHTAAAAFGLSAVVAAHPGVLAGVRVAGAAYLAWLGARALWTAFRGPAPPPAGPPRAARAYVDGLAGNLLNPKAVLFFLGLIPQFVVPGPAVTGQILVCAATTVVAAGLWFATVIAVVRRTSAGVRRGRGRRAVDALSGAALVAVAAGTAAG